MKDVSVLLFEAENGVSSAMVELGICYLNGKRIQKNRLEAVKMFRKASNYNNCEGMYNLAICLLKGRGCKVNELEAIGFLKKAVELNHNESLILLGNIYSNTYHTKSIKKDIIEAKHYYQISARNKDIWGMQFLASIYIHEFENKYEAKKLYFESYKSLNLIENYIITLKNYEIRFLSEKVVDLFTSDKNYDRNLICSLFIIQSFKPPYLWKIIKDSGKLKVKQLFWEKEKDETMIKNILKQEFENGDIDNIEEPFIYKPTISEEYLDVKSKILEKLVGRLGRIRIPFDLNQENYVIADGTSYSFYYKTFTSSIKLSWNTYMPLKWKEFNEFIKDLKDSIHEDSKAIRLDE